jgi:hypothetical protein
MGFCLYNVQVFGAPFFAARRSNLMRLWPYAPENARFVGVFVGRDARMTIPA